MIRQVGPPPGEPQFTIEIVTDPVECARAQQQHERARKNSDWLQANWDKVLPRAYGKFIVIAGQAAFIADTPEEAWKMAEAAHPEDNGAFIRYVRPGKGPRIYASRG